jgi:hypothetical protein
MIKMMQDVHVKLNPGLPWQKQLLTRKRIFSSANWTQIQGRTSKMVLLQHAVSGVDSWILRKVDQKYPASFEVWYRKGMDRSAGLFM